jgi:hypothetical protein
LTSWLGVHPTLAMLATPQTRAPSIPRAGGGNDRFITGSFEQ